MVEVGTTTFSGIFLTKFFGVSVLAMAKSRSTRVYFFRTFFSFVVFGGFHALVLLPVLLLLIGDAGRQTTAIDEYEEDDEFDIAARSAISQSMSHCASDAQGTNSSAQSVTTVKEPNSQLALEEQDGIHMGV